MLWSSSFSTRVHGGVSYNLDMLNASSGAVICSCTVLVDACLADNTDDEDDDAESDTGDAEGDANDDDSHGDEDDGDDDDGDGDGDDDDEESDDDDEEDEESDDDDEEDSEDVTYLERGELQIWPDQPLPTRVFIPFESLPGNGAQSDEDDDEDEDEDEATALKERHPILVFLHGAPPDGSFFIPRHKTESLPASLQYNKTFASTFKFITIMPCSTCNSAGRPIIPEGPPPVSGDVGWTPDNFARIDHSVRNAIRDLGGDPYRVYLTGQSYGGRGAMQYAMARRYMFAAVVPVCPAIPLFAPSMADVLCCSLEEVPPGMTRSSCCPPFWIFHGANDKRAAVENSDNWIEALRAQSRPPELGVRYTRYDKAPPFKGDAAGHAAYELAYKDEDLWEWLGQVVCSDCQGPPVIKRA